MPRLRRPPIESSEELSVWTSFTDLMSNAFMILSLFLILSILLYSSALKESNVDPQKLVQLEKENKQLQQELERLKTQYKDIPQGIPPIIVIPDNEAFRFAPGSAVLSPALRKYVWQGLWSAISENENLYKINTVEIIGHTDGQPNQRASSNLDIALENAARSNQPSSLRPGSNADLGLMRALAIASELQKIQRQTGKLTNIQFRAYSAAQLYNPDGNLAPPNRASNSARRRVEVRFTKLGAERLANTQP